jgi:hypothetical protein
MISSLAGRIAVLVLAVLFCTLGLTLLLGYNKYRTALAAAVENRFLFVLTDLKQTIDLGLGLGVRLEDLGSTRNLLERETEGDAAITFIEVFDAGGQVLFSTDPGGVGDLLPQRYVEIAAGSQWQSVIEPGSDMVAMVMPLTSPIGAPIGGLILGWSRETLSARHQEMAATLAGIGITGCGVFGVALLCGLWLTFRAPRRRLAALRDILAELAEGRDPPAASIALADDPLIERFAAQAGHSRREIGTTLANVRALDEAT